MAAEFRPPDDWPKIPEIPVEFKPDGEGGLTADVDVDLGILGKWTPGNFQIDKALLRELEDPEFRTECMREITEEVQHAFSKLLIRIVAAAMVNDAETRDNELLIRYKQALTEFYGEDKATDIFNHELASMGYRITMFKGEFGSENFRIE